MKSLQVTDEVHERLMILKGVLGANSASDVIISLMNARKFNDAFFHRLQEMIPDE